MKNNSSNQILEVVTESNINSKQNVCKMFVTRYCVKAQRKIQSHSLVSGDLLRTALAPTLRLSEFSDFASPLHHTCSAYQ